MSQSVWRSACILRKLSGIRFRSTWTRSKLNSCLDLGLGLHSFTEAGDFRPRPILKWTNSACIVSYQQRVMFGTTESERELDCLTQISLPGLDFIMLEKGPKAKFTVSIEGNIGSGKSTLLQHFNKFNDVDVLQEPVEKWRDVRGYNLLDLMYKDPCRWAHTFQTYVQMTMLELHLKPTTAPVKLIERSLFSARYCFVENLYSNKKMSGPEYAVYCEWYKTIIQNLDVGLDLIVYLRTDPERLHERIKKRARTEEQTIPLQYLEDLHRLHEEWLIEKKHGLSTSVLILDANDSLPTMYKKFEEHTADILCQKLGKPRNEEGEGLVMKNNVLATATN